jgi:hypothetical protein
MLQAYINSQNDADDIDESRDRRRKWKVDYKILCNQTKTDDGDRILEIAFYFDFMLLVHS